MRKKYKTFPVFFLVNICVFVNVIHSSDVSGGGCVRVEEYYPTHWWCDTNYPYLTHTLSYSSYIFQFTLTFKLIHRK